MTRPIHVLHVVPTLGRGGMELALARIVRGLSRPTFTHSVVCLAGDSIIGDEFDSATPIYCMHGESEPIPSLSRLRRLLARTQPSLIHARNLSAWSDVALVRLTLRTRPPLVLSFHGTDHAGPLPRRRRVMAAISGRSATRLFAVSAPARDFLVRSLRLRADRITIIPNGIDTRRFVPSMCDTRPKQSLVVGTVGNLSPVKNQSLLVRACAELLASDVPIELRIAGEGSKRDRLTQLAASLGISKSIHLLGHVTDVPGFLQTLDLFVLPSDSEAHPNALIEAMACGLPCVASRVGGIPDVLVDDSVGRLFDRGDLSGLVSAMRDLIAAPDTRAALGRAARKRVEEHYGLDDMIRRYATLYSEVASQ
jgi:glycosyltransferase involved in cell wall biosynthesis